MPSMSSSMALPPPPAPRAGAPSAPAPRPPAGKAATAATKRASAVAAWQPPAPLPASPPAQRTPFKSVQERRKVKVQAEYLVATRRKEATNALRAGEWARAAGAGVGGGALLRLGSADCAATAESGAASDAASWRLARWLRKRGIPQYVFVLFRTVGTLPQNALRGRSSSAELNALLAPLSLRPAPPQVRGCVRGAGRDDTRRLAVSAPR
jgi:hypothetical protein